MQTCNNIAIRISKPLRVSTYGSFETVDERVLGVEVFASVVHGLVAAGEDLGVGSEHGVDDLSVDPARTLLGRDGDLVVEYVDVGQLDLEVVGTQVDGSALPPVVRSRQTREHSVPGTRGNVS